MGTLVEVRRDGKLYPPRQRSAAEVARLRDTEHHLHCRLGLSIRAIQKALLTEDIRRSIGMIHRDLHQFECPLCSTAPRPAVMPSPDPRQKAQVFAWR